MIYTLNSAGFEARGFSDGTGFFDAIGEEKPELIMLDIMLPGEDGIAILKRRRSTSVTAEIPVIMATAKGTEYDKVIGLDLGADDYLAKPFGMMEMVSRVKAVLRRSRPREDTQILRAGCLELNMEEHTVSVGGERIVLTLKEYELLQIFMEHPGRVFTRDRLSICLAVNRSLELQELLQKAGDGEHAEMRMELAGGVHQLDASPVFSDGLVFGVVLLMLDVTEKEKAEQMRREFTASGSCYGVLFLIYVTMLLSIITGMARFL